eukprot:TRINITY_DN17176_c0_g1_i1.p1 TRINITY_DN17176_c0_g1~~TRINITY_DN17176_c0_g1_i1.p1  ORF type:complete len:270 (-),score=52.50 TRINITY_DN17176_c0_g1_i1:611-1420(-)
METDSESRSPSPSPSFAETNNNNNDDNENVLANTTLNPSDFSNLNSGAVLTPYHSFGIQGRVKDCIFYLDANHVVFPVGRFIAIANLDSKEMSFLPEHETGGKVKSVLAMALTPNKKYLALSERLLDSHAQVSIINLSTLKRQRVLPFTESKEVVSICFSGDGRYLVAQGGKPDWTIIVWNWDKGAVLNTSNPANAMGNTIGSSIAGMGKVQHPVGRISFNFYDNAQLVTSGKKILAIVENGRRLFTRFWTYGVEKRGPKLHRSYLVYG